MLKKKVSTTINTVEVQRYLDIKIFSDVYLIDPEKEYEIAEIGQILSLSDRQIEKIIEQNFMTHKGDSIIHFVKGD